MELQNRPATHQVVQQDGQVELLKEQMSEFKKLHEALILAVESNDKLFILF